MSDWAYRECEICGNRIHVNHTCKEWNKKQCDGDPWDINVRRNEDLNKLKAQRKLLLLQLETIDSEIYILEELLK